MAGRERAFITGVCGQDGSYLAEYLVSLGYEVVGVTRQTTHLPVWTLRFLEQARERFHLVTADVTDTERMRCLLELWQPGEVYNLAAQSHVGMSWSRWSETWRVNALAAISLMHLCADATVLPLGCRFYQASTSELFGDSPPPQSEATAVRPLSPYGAAKAAAHLAAAALRRRGVLWVACGILFNHESPRRGAEFVTQKTATQVAELAFGRREHLSLGDLRPRRDWGYAPDYVRAMHAMLKVDEPDDFVVATGHSHSVRQFVEWCLEAAGLKQNLDEVLRFDSGAARPNDIMALRGDARKARAVLGWYPTLTAREVARVMTEAAIERVQRSS